MPTKSYPQEKTAFRLADLQVWFNMRLDKIHSETLQKFRTLTRSVGQYTKVKK